MGALRRSVSMAVNHYENFPVASILLPIRLRRPVEAIYAFARTADDLADEGNATPFERIAALKHYETQLDQIADGTPTGDPLFRRLHATIDDWQLPLAPFRDLLSAFRQDVMTLRYANYPALMDYCRRSANPVGTLMLSLYGANNPRHRTQSDAICSALQLINFCQDVAIDWQKGRIYLPMDELARFQVSCEHLERQRVDAAWRNLMSFQIERARALLLSGAPLASTLRGRIGWELRLVVQGGLRILERIETADYDIFRHRPQLGLRDWLAMMLRAVRMRAEVAVASN